MKICIITNTYSSEALGGATVYTEKISNELAQRNNEILIITVSHNNEDAFELKNNKKIYRFYPLNVSTFNKIARKSFFSQGIWTILDIYNYYSYIRIKAILKKEKPDVVHIHTPVDITLSAFDAVKSLNLPNVFTLHDYLLLCRRNVLLHGFRRMCTNQNMNPLCKIYRNFSRKIVNNKPDVVIAPSNFILEMFKKNGFFKNCKTTVLPYGIELDGFRPSEKDDNKQNFNILYVGSLTSHKGIQVLIKAVKQVKNNNLRLDIVGDGNYKDSLNELAADDGRITFYGKINNENINSFYSRADVLVVPSIWYEVLGIVILEAFRAGVPVIGSRIGGIPEVIKDNYNGYLFNAGDIAGLKNILENIIEKPVKLAVLGRNASESVLRYEMSQHVDKLTSIYGEAIEINKLRH